MQSFLVTTTEVWRRRVKQKRHRKHKVRAQRQTETLERAIKLFSKSPATSTPSSSFSVFMSGIVASSGCFIGSSKSSFIKTTLCIPIYADYGRWLRRSRTLRFSIMMYSTTQIRCKVKPNEKKKISQSLSSVAAVDDGRIDDPYKQRRQPLESHIRDGGIRSIFITGQLRRVFFEGALRCFQQISMHVVNAIIAI